jgi:hypothetical protein
MIYLTTYVGPFSEVIDSRAFYAQPGEVYAFYRCALLHPALDVSSTHVYAVNALRLYHLLLLGNHLCCTFSREILKTMLSSSMLMCPSMIHSKLATLLL